jgi:hypothetical protein
MWAISSRSLWSRTFSNTWDACWWVGKATYLGLRANCSNNTLHGGWYIDLEG